MLTRSQVVAIAAVISVVLITLTAWGHRHSDNQRAGAAISAGQRSTSPASPTRASSSSAPASSSSAPASSSPAPASRTASATPSKPRVTVRQLAASLQALFGPGDSYSVAGYDLTTGHSISAGAGAGMTEASVIKLDILETALYHRQQTGYDFNENDAEAMMENSDNAAADRIFDYDGGNSGVQPYNTTVGLSNTQLDPTETWGLSTTSAADQLLLLQQLVSSRSVLNSTSRAYALQLMGDVEDDQNWGIPAAADPGISSQLKNGWLNIDRDNGLWAVNSVGLTTSGGHRMLLAVLSQHQPDFQTGVNRVGPAAQQLAAALLDN